MQEAPQGKAPSAEQIVSVVGEGLMALGQMLEGNPQLQDRVAGLVEELQAIVGEASSGQPAQPPPGAPAAMQQGGNPNAKPV